MTTERLGLIERLSYGMGDLGTSLAYNTASAFLLFFYVNVSGLPAGAVGTIFLLARLLDAVFDMVVGVSVDKTRTRWGRMRPYFLFTALPYAICTVLVFVMPPWSQTAQLVYAFVTFKALGLLMSLQAIPYTAILPTMTIDTTQRLKLSGMRSLGTSVGVVLATAATMPLVGLLGGGDQKRGFMLVAMIYAAIGLVATLSLFGNCKERHLDTSSPRFPILPAVGQMLRNRAWLVCFGFCLVYFVRFGVMMSATVNFCIDVLGNPGLISIMLPAVAGMLLLSSFIAPTILAVTGLRAGSVTALGLSMAFFGALPMLEGQPTLFLTSYFLACLSSSITITAAFTMIAETVNHHERQFGVRREGLLSSGISLATKVGMALGSAGFAYTLAFVDYMPGAVTDLARDGIRWVYYASAIVLQGLQLLIVLFWPSPVAVAAREAGQTA